ncbi:MAG TPA: hypothetical protein VMS22_14825 [Candidatus Eisenbacteria bacterium]|nr:hypothetical protein [Candidatus Eisenbacteria bacterium]
MITGSCLCGGVVFEIDAALTPMQYRHAARCRKATGAAFAAEVLASASGLRWTRGQDLVTLFEAPLLRHAPRERRVPG